MNNSQSVQAYLPSPIVLWLGSEARMAKVSRGHWVATLLTDLFQGLDVQEEAHAHTQHMQRQLAFAMCVLDGLLGGHSDRKLRERVRVASRKRVERKQLRNGK